MLIHVVPILLGDGVRFFNCPGLSQGIRLEPLEVAQSGKLTNLWFRVVK